MNIDNAEETDNEDFYIYLYHYAGPNNNNQDLIAVQDYDGFERESKAWLPVYRTTGTGNVL
ncbi:MAG: hypothetical protein FWF52_03890 [Candidatus Azobacteroides sp.]|nr:hypothetical protein [Candidatus Azobacteroides sp.]